jgi:hypothetical protein
MRLPRLARLCVLIEIRPFSRARFDVTRITAAA